MENSTTKGNSTKMVAVAAFAAFLATFNETYLNIAFAPIMSDLAVDVNTVQWLATAYMLGAAVMVPVSAFAFKNIHTRSLFCITTALLVIGSIVGALAPNFAVLLTGRIIQALGTGMMIPVGMNITLLSAPREKLGTYMGIMGAMTTLGPSVSVIAAGLLLAVLPWNALFWIFAALSALCFLSGAVFLRDVTDLSHPKLDALSVVLIGLGLIGLLYGVSSAFGGSLMIALGAMILGIVFVALFVRRQKMIVDPLIDLRPLGVTAFSMGVIGNMLALLIIFAMNILVPMFLQSALGVDSLFASLALFPAIILSCVISPVAGRIYDKHGARILLPLGFACIAVFSVLVSFAMSTGSIVVIAALYIPVICGSALIIGPIQSLALSTLPPELNSHGVTILSTGFQIAGCVGSSLFTGVYGAVLGARIAAGEAFVQAASSGFLAAGILVAVCAAAGFALTISLTRKAAASAEVASKERAEAKADGITLASIMKRDVFTLSPADTVEAAISLLAEKGISGVPVVDNGTPVGFISDGDVMRYLAAQTPAFKTAYSFIAEKENGDFNAVVSDVLKLSVGDICAKRVISVPLDSDLGEVCRILAEHHLKKVPVMDAGTMVGIINRSNITKYAVKSYLGVAAAH